LTSTLRFVATVEGNRFSPYPSKVEAVSQRARPIQTFGLRKRCCDIDRGVVTAFMLLLLGSVAAAQTPRLKNIQLCNGEDRTTPDAQITGCSALIDSGEETPQILAIALNNRGNAYTAKGEYDLAVKDYDRAIQLNPSYPKPINNRGVAYEKIGEFDRAMEDFSQAIKIDPNYAGPFANRAAIHAGKHEYDHAVRDYDEAIRLAPVVEPAVWNGRCWGRTILGDLQGALSDCNEALRLDANYTAALDSRGFISLKTGKWNAAIQDYNLALEHEPRLASSLYGRAIAKRKTGDTAGANADMAAATAIAPNIRAEFASYGLQSQD
jgi:lipoprotein NlpI